AYFNPAATEPRLAWSALTGPGTGRIITSIRIETAYVAVLMANADAAPRLAAITPPMAGPAMEVEAEFQPGKSGSPGKSSRTAHRGFRDSMAGRCMALSAAIRADMRNSSQLWGRASNAFQTRIRQQAAMPDSANTINRRRST